MTGIFDSRVDNDTLVMILEKYQGDDKVHQFTCGTCRVHDLVPAIEGDDVILECPNCDYKQTVTDRLRSLMGSYMATRP